MRQNVVCGPQPGTAPGLTGCSLRKRHAGAPRLQRHVGRPKFPRSTSGRAAVQGSDTEHTRPHSFKGAFCHDDFRTRQKFIANQHDFFIGEIFAQSGDNVLGHARDVAAEMDQGTDAVGVAHVVQLFGQVATDEQVAGKERLKDADDAATGAAFNAQAGAEDFRGRLRRARLAGGDGVCSCLGRCARNTNRLCFQSTCCLRLCPALSVRLNSCSSTLRRALFLVSRGPPSFFCQACD